MNNLDLPAHPTEVQWSEGKIGKDHQNGYSTSLAYGFSKLELAALMIAQGLCADHTMDSVNVIPEMSVRIAKAVLEEANK